LTEKRKTRTRTSNNAKKQTNGGRTCAEKICGEKPKDAEKKTTAEEGRKAFLASCGWGLPISRGKE